jgi:hypothetical protein
MELTLNRIKWDSGKRCVCRDRKEIQAHRALAWLARDFGKKGQVTDAVPSHLPFSTFPSPPIHHKLAEQLLQSLGGRLNHGYFSAKVGPWAALGEKFS